MSRGPRHFHIFGIAWYCGRSVRMTSLSEKNRVVIESATLKATATPYVTGKLESRPPTAHL